MNMLILLALVFSQSPDDTVVYTFDTPEAAASFDGTAGGEGARKDVKPKIAEGKLFLLDSWWKFNTSVAFRAPRADTVRFVTASWKMTMVTGTEGCGFAWLHAGKHRDRGPAPVVERWEAPDIPASFAVGFDARNPVNRDPFRGSGNVYGRPEHEVSLHFDGKELVKRATPMDFRDEEPHEVKLDVEFLTGGAEVSLSIDGTLIYDRYFIASMTAYAGRPAFGGRNAETAGVVLLDDLAVTCREKMPEPEPPLKVKAIDRALNDTKHHRNEGTASFPRDTDEYGRIVCTLRLDEPEKGFDPWDRIASICAFADNGDRVEIVRYITPYDKGHEWKIDVTDFRPILKGDTRIEQACVTYGEGWMVTVEFDLYPGPCDRLARKVVTLWSGAPEVGNPEKPPEGFYHPASVKVDQETTYARVRTVVTGHGMYPNTDNAAEFMPLGRTLAVNGESFRNVLWKTDNYLNPCRPQGGTWKYDRAGWAPGDVVAPWCVDVSHLIGDERELKISYTLDPYLNEGRGDTWAPTHRTEAHLILYSAVQ